MRKILFPLLVSLAFPIAVNANSEVNNSLNMADMYFRSGKKSLACKTVSLAILKANSPEVYGTTSSSLKREVKEYANKCDLRF